MKKNIKEQCEMGNRQWSSLIIGLLIASCLLPVVIVSCKNKKTSVADNNQRKEQWTCSMHPEIIRDKPGTCPICGMDLIKKEENRSEEHTSELQSHHDLVCRLLLEKKKQH